MPYQRRKTMRTLTVENFSCIKMAEMEIDRLTVIIGPQASGKSVIGKLSYFSIDIGLSQYSALIRNESFEAFCNSIKEKFIDWFPVSAWGSGKFKITFSAGKYSVSFRRKSYKGVNSEDFRLIFSDEFKQSYKDALKSREKQISSQQHDLSYEVEYDWRIRELARTSFKKITEKDGVEYQVFIPAGRSFFTSIGKAIAAFEQGRVLDPLILRFGRMFTAYKDHPRSFFNERQSDKENRLNIEELINSVLGGKLYKQGDKEFVLSDDGRKIPLSALSSGQQELLPLITVLPWFSRTEGSSLCYIEEPEAHLFPSTQSKLIQALVMLCHSTNLVITTHSPYVLTKLNNLLKAGSLGRKRNDELKNELEKYVPKKAWLSARTMRAYAIKDGVLIPILGKDGFIDAEYLDEISQDLNSEFSLLLDLEEKYA